MIHSGLDWSGSPGKAHGTWLVLAVVHIEASDLGTLDEELASTKRRLALDGSHVFSHTGSGSRTRTAFFNVMRRVPFTSHVHMLDKNAWADQQIGKPTGPACPRDGILTFIVRCPDSVVAENVLYIDVRADETRALEDYRTSIRQSLRAARPRRAGFKNVRACADHRLQGGTIQLADMIAGEVREHGGLSGPYLPLLGSRIRLA